MSTQRKNRPRARPSATDKTGLQPLPPAEKYGGQISRERAIEMFEHAQRHILHTAFSDSWSEVDKTRWWSAIEILSQKVSSLRPNIREILLPQLNPDQPGSAFREFEYYESAQLIVEVIYEVLETAKLECGEDFQERLKREIVKQFRRTELPRLAKPNKEVNREMIRILRKFVKAHSRGEREPLLKELAPDGQAADHWAHDTSVKLKRFCVRAYHVWLRWDSPPLEQIEQVRFIPNARVAFRTECSLEFRSDTEIAREAIRRGQELTYKRKQRELLKTRPAKPVRRK